MLYHGYENGFRTLGRQVLLEPVSWDSDGWPHAQGGDLSRPLPKPRGGAGGAGGSAFSDDFSSNKFGVQWRFFRPAADEMARARYEERSLVLRGKGATPAESSPITFTPGDHAYEVSVILEDLAGAQGGLLLFYNQKAYFGFGFDGRQMFSHAYAAEQSWMRSDVVAQRLHLKLENRRHIVTMRYSTDGASWTKHPWQFEVSGVHHNVLGDFLSLRPALYACGSGNVRFREFRYRALD
jgi:xylan 1,4-beta-xylosidase